MANNKENVEQAEAKAYLEDGRTRGWFWDFNDVFESDLSEHAIVIRLYLAKCSNGKRQAWPSLNKIAQKCKISKPTVIKALKELEEKGWLQKIMRKHPNQEYATTIYILQDPPVPPSLNGNSDKTRDKKEKEKGGKTDLPPVKNKKGVVNEFYHPVNEVDNLVNEVDPNKTHGIIPSEQEKDQLFVFSLRSNTNNGTAGSEPTDAVVDDTSTQKNTGRDSHPCAGAAYEAGYEEKKRDSRPYAGEADGAGCENKSHSGRQGLAYETSHKSKSRDNHPCRAGEEKFPTNKELIALLVNEYRAIEGVLPTKGDYAFIGALYNSHGYDCVLEAIHELSLAMAAQRIEKPLIYLKGISRNKFLENNKSECVHKQQSIQINPEKEAKKELLRSLYC